MQKITLISAKSVRRGILNNDEHTVFMLKEFGEIFSKVKIVGIEDF